MARNQDEAQRDSQVGNEVSKGLFANLFPQGQDGISFVENIIILAVLAIMVITRDEALADWRFLAGILCVIAILLLHVFQKYLRPAFRDQSYEDIVLLSAISLLALGASWLSQSSITIYLPAMITGMAFRLLQVPVALILSLLVSGLWLLVAKSFPYADASTYAGYILSLSLGALMFGAISYLIRRNDRQTEEAKVLAMELKTANRQLLSSRTQDNELAASEERMKLARDIHDGLGHHLTVLNVQLQVAEQLIKQSPEKVSSVLETCRHEAQAALEEVRRSVTVMRGTPLDTGSLEDALKDLVSEFDAISPLTVTFETNGDPHELTTIASLTCYRAVQEGLTNVQKHAQSAAKVWVLLEFGSARVMVRVRDDGISVADYSGQSGFGLRGLRERAEQLGGELRVEPSAGDGFLLELAIPMEKGDDSYTAGR